MGKVKAYLKLLRVHHYIKNFLVFLPLVFGGGLFEGSKFACCLLGFVAFCLVSSSVYIINDLKDVERDKRHPVKKKRPLAAGEVKKSQAVVMVVILLALSLAVQILMLGLFEGINAALMFGWLYGYLVLNMLYSFWLKNYPIVDLIALSFGFVLRVLYGGVIVDIQVSNYLFVTVLAISLYAAMGKRRNEIAKNGSKARSVLKYYNKNFLDKNMYLFLAIALVCYLLWCIQGTTYVQDDRLVFSSILLFFVVMRYSLNIEGDSLGDPIDVVLHDKVLLAGGLLYGILMVVLLYA